MSPTPLELVALGIIVVGAFLFLGFQYLTRALADPLEKLAPLSNGRKPR